MPRFALACAVVALLHACANDPAARAPAAASATEMTAAPQDPVPAATTALEWPRVEIVETEHGRGVMVGSARFTEYRHAGALDPMPILYPVLGPDGVPMTRDYPMREARRGEAEDHEHHRSIWFAHGAVNGRDFWHGTGSHDVIQHLRYVPVEAAAAHGRTIHTQNAWVGHDGATVCTDDRWLVFGAEPGDASRFIDLTITVIASHGDVKFGDTKEGTMAVRVHPALRLKGKVATGSIVNSEGHRNAEAWGKRARWVAYYGTVDGQDVGLALFDHPRNLRHPCWWHARDYGLLAANPFGAHDFENAPKGAGDWVLEDGQRRTFRYRIVLFRGTPQSARIAERYETFAKNLDLKSPGRDR